MEDFIAIGKTQKAHGLNGELRVSLEARFVEALLDVDALFLMKKGELLPFFVEYVRGNTESILKFEDLETREDVLPLVGKKVMVRRQDLDMTDAEIEDSGLEYSYLKGFMMFDEVLGQLAEIEDILDFPQQELALLVVKDRDVLVPMRKEWIEKIDEGSKTIRMNLPDGLLDL